jgi:DNA-binding NarL/FixJ family response regulator
LSRNESGELITTVLGGRVDRDCTDRMHKLSGGNVLFLRHLLEHELESGRLTCIDDEWRWSGTPSVSPSLVELVEQQIGMVPEDVRDVVDLTAVSEPVDREVLATLSALETIEAAEQRGLIAISSTTDAVYVGHPLYGEIRLAQCGSQRLRRLRGRLASAMAQADSADPLRLGLLWLDSDLPPDPAILLRAAHISAARLDLGLAERLPRAAVDASPTPTTKVTLAYILVLRAKGQAADEILNTLSTSELAVPDAMDGVTLHAANHLFLLGTLERARTIINDAIGLGDADRNRGLFAYRAVIEVMAAEPDRVLSTMAHVDYSLMDDFSRLIGYAAETIALGDLGRVTEAADRARAGYHVLDESPLEAFHGTGLAEFDAFAHLAAGYVNEACAMAEREHQRCKDLAGLSLTLAVAALGMTALGRGDLPAAVRQLRSAKDRFDNSEVFVPFYRFDILLTEALARSGDVDGAVAAMAATRQGRHPSYIYVESGYLLSCAWVAATQGRISEARENACRAAEFARAHGQRTREVLSLQAAVQFGDASGAGRLAELATMVEGPRVRLVARYARALADDDSAALDAVSLDFEAMGDALAAVDAAAQAATSHRMAGRRGSALTASARAQRLAKECGGAMSPALAVAEVPLPFTRREHEIAQLLAQGMSNRAIADAMSLSIRTVQGHIYQASTKAGVTSRSELSAMMKKFNEIAATVE